MTDVPEPKMKIGISVKTTKQMAPYEGFEASAWVSVAIDNMIPAGELKGIYDEYRPELMDELTRQIDAEKIRRGMIPAETKPAQPPAPSPSAAVGHIDRSTSKTELEFEKPAQPAAPATPEQKQPPSLKCQGCGKSVTGQPSKYKKGEYYWKCPECGYFKPDGAPKTRRR